MSQLPDMHSIPSTWDVIPGKSTTHLLHLKPHILNSYSTITIQDLRLQHLLPGKATALKETVTPTQPDPQLPSNRELTSALPKTPAQDAEHEIDINPSPDCSHFIFQPPIVNLILTFNKEKNLFNSFYYFILNPHLIIMPQIKI